VTSDFRLHPLYSKALEDKSVEITNLVFEKIIPAIGKPMIPYLLKDYDPKGKKKADSRRLALLGSLGYESACELAKRAIAEKASEDIQSEAAYILRAKAENEELLLSLGVGKKAGIRESALLALVEMGSQKGIKLVLEALQSDKYQCALKAATACNDRDFLKELTAYTKTAGFNASKERDEKKKRPLTIKAGSLSVLFCTRKNRNMPLTSTRKSTPTASIAKPWTDSACA
jgi:hypothetical protein